MAVDIVTYASEFVPTADGTPSGGDIDLGAEIADNGVFIPASPIPDAGDPDIVQYYALCKKNEGASDLLVPKFLMPNGITPAVSAGPISVQSDSASETGAVRVYFKVAGVWTSEDVPSLGTALGTGSLTCDADSPMFAQKVTDGGALSSATGNIVIFRGVAIGLILANRKSATSAIRIGLDLTVNDDLQTADRLDPPAGITFSRAYTTSSGIQIPGPVDLAAGEFVKVWIEYTLFNGQPQPLTSIQPGIRVKGQAA